MSLSSQSATFLLGSTFALSNIVIAKLLPIPYMYVKEIAPLFSFGISIPEILAIINLVFV